MKLYRKAMAAAAALVLCRCPGAGSVGVSPASATQQQICGNNGTGYLR